MIPEPSFPAKADEFIGRQTQIESFRGRAFSRAEQSQPQCWGTGASERAICF